MCRGLLAASGELGALIAAVLLNYASDSRSFLTSEYCFFASSIVALATAPENNNVDSLEIDKNGDGLLMMVVIAMMKTLVTIITKKHRMEEDDVVVDQLMHFNQL